MTILERVDALARLLDIKDQLADETKANNAAIEKAKAELAELMLEEETPKVSRAGYSYSVAAKTRYSKKGGHDEDLMQTLRDFGLGALIKETVNAQTLQGAMSNLADENDGELPDEFSECINTYEFVDITRRKDAKKK